MISSDLFPHVARICYFLIIRFIFNRFAYHVHLWQLDGHNFEGHQPNVRSLGKDQLIRIICQPAGISEKVTFTPYCLSLQYLRGIFYALLKDA